MDRQKTALSKTEHPVPEKPDSVLPEEPDFILPEEAVFMRQEELSRLNEIQKIIREQLNASDCSIGREHRDIIEQKRYLWENIYELDPAEIRSAKAVISGDQSLHAQRLEQHRLLQRLQKNPYFARIDFVYDGEEEAETFYIGLGGLRSTDGRSALIYDWRAPISSMYYDYDIGSASYEAPAGRIEGEIVHKRQLKIRNGTLEYVLSSGFKIDDELLQRALAANSSTKMQNIVATIQREQNAVVRDSAAGILLVQGTAGSGKTSVALHRIAYLLYRNRKTLHSSQILLLSPNRIFTEYISDVLPELGEQNICEMSLDEFALHERDFLGAFETKYAQLENVIRCRPAQEHRLPLIRFKKSLCFLKELKSYGTKLEDHLVVFSDYTFSRPARSEEEEARGHTASADELRKWYRGSFSSLPLFQRLERMAEQIADDFEAEHTAELSALSREEIRHGLFALCKTTDVLELYAAFLRSLKEKYPLLESGIIPEKNHLVYEDVFPVLLMKTMLFGTQTSRFDRVRHVVVDEMQDYSMVQYELLRLLFPCSMTILGDVSQQFDGGTAACSAPEAFLNDIREVFGGKAALVRLEKSYRSTLEISEFCRKLGGLSGTSAFARRGKALLLKKYPDFPGMAAGLQNRLDQIDPEKIKTAAIICKTAEAAENLYLTFDKEHRERCRRLLTEEDDFREGILLTSSYLAKGLEFDLVIVPEVTAEEYCSETDRRILYIECTRALHELELLYYKEASPFLTYAE